MDAHSIVTQKKAENCRLFPQAQTATPLCTTMVCSIWQAGRTQQIAYASSMNANGHIYELVMYQDHPWSVEDIMRQPIGAASADGFALVAYDWKAAGTKQLVYSGRDGHLHELSAGV